MMTNLTRGTHRPQSRRKPSTTGSLPSALRTGRDVRTRAAAGSALALASLAIAGAALAADPFLRRTATVRAVESVGPAVVNIVAEHHVRQSSPFPNMRGNPLFESFFHDFFPSQGSRTVQNLGSGVIINSAGHM